MSCCWHDVTPLLLFIAVAGHFRAPGHLAQLASIAVGGLRLHTRDGGRRRLAQIQ
ncbi:uncharacterized protein PHACADRAFT_203044 [Phanerochaete carnosa HHB-10118-sp]|uniref:Uncharacterized protein n=1 Tax=Phanerochaete carnosa (strain HHB-10118-sp) TaxID=650164 RepID=K5VB01_PHACS|nr:uncharacterized protein PHACADRAFT_203044 [Phanerochaete carnosa HHB-10118-sp]EKM48253.1 hypothetical protein PHACADRAFT_203044 [Phanerochaete carnosa HHB-10118-sp]